MRETFQEIIDLQGEYSARNTPHMKRRGELIRKELPNELRHIGESLRKALGRFGDDADAEGKDNMGQMSRIPWVRWYSKSRSPSATTGWYVVFLFHPDASGVSLCLSHGSTQIEDGNLTSRSEEEVAELMQWAAFVVGDEFRDERAVSNGISLGSFQLARAYEKTTLFSKFYRSELLPEDGAIENDLVRFISVLAKLYDAQERGIQPGSLSPDYVLLRDEVQRIISPLSASKVNGQGRGLSGAARKLVEYEAMRQARGWLKSNGFDFEDVSATDSCDFRAKRRGENWIVEVKGTTGGPGSILLTRNEVTLHRSAFPLNALIIVHGIQLSSDGIRVDDPGTLLAFAPWTMEEQRLKPVCFEHKF